MSKRDEMRELYEKEDKVKKFAEKDGAVYVSFEDAAVLNSLNAYDPKGTGIQLRNRDGSLASTGKTVHAVNPDYFFLNRYKVKGTGASRRMLVVSGHEPTGWRCITEQQKGKIFIKTIPCYVFYRDAESKELVLEKVATVSDSEFISDFTNTLDNKSMAEILPLITEKGNDVTASSMPI